MAKSTQGAWGTVKLVSMPKKTRQGRSANTLLSATSRNKAKKKYRGQGKQTTGGAIPLFLLLNSKNILKLWKTPRKRC